MNKKSDISSHTPTPKGVKDSAQEIWLAGLGAFAKAQQEGGKVFEALVEDGLAMQRKTQETARLQMAEATEKLSAMAGGLSSRAGQQWDRLEGIFEERVARALHRLNVATGEELQELRARIEALESRAATTLKRTPRTGTATGKARQTRTPAGAAKAPARRSKKQD